MDNEWRQKISGNCTYFFDEQDKLTLKLEFDKGGKKVIGCAFYSGILGDDVSLRTETEVRSDGFLEYRLIDRHDRLRGLLEYPWDTKKAPFFSAWDEKGNEIEATKFDNSKALGEKETEILKFILTECAKEQRSICGTEVSKAFGYKSPNTAYIYIRKLIKKGYLERVKNSRGYIPTGTQHLFE